MQKSDRQSSSPMVWRALGQFIRVGNNVDGFYQPTDENLVELECISKWTLPEWSNAGFAFTNWTEQIGY